MSKVTELKKWILELVPYGEDFAKYVKVVTDEASGTGDLSVYEHKYTVILYTKSRRHYYIRAEDKSADDGYLGCTRDNDFHLAGEDHTRGHDLPDGPFTEETWRKIVHAIVASELRELGT